MMDERTVDTQEMMLQDEDVLEEMLDTDGEPQPVQDDAAPQQDDPAATPTPAPEGAQPERKGWIRRRIEEGVRRETAALEYRLRQEYERKLQPLREAALANEAAQLVAQGEFRTQERAMEYLRLKTAAPAPQGGTLARAQRLAEQARTIEAMGGVDVMAALRSDEAVRARVLGGEWDFTDVYRHLQAQPAAHPAEPPVRSHGAAPAATPDIRTMSTRQLERMNRLLAQGGQIRFDR